jgi:glycosyltransferase involved in cell wall biosynthesis
MIATNVTATVSTKGRYHTTFPLVLTSLVNQTLKPSKLIIYDDNDVLEDLRENEIYRNLFTLLNRVGVNWEVIVGERKGQIWNHQRALKEVTTDWIWRLDDDNVMENNTLESLYNYAQTSDNIGAVGPLILDPKTEMNNAMASNKIEDIFLGLNIQWCNLQKDTQVEVDHLQGSTFLFRRAAASHGYDLTLSKVGHREETIFTYEMKRAGWRLVVLTSVKTWHMRYGAGGIRSDHQIKLFENDESIFYDYIKKWNVRPRTAKIIPLNSGIGDHYAFRSVLYAIKEKHKHHRIIIGACYPAVFEGEEGIEVVSLGDTLALVKEDDYNVYRWMDQRNWKKSLSEAYKLMYTT